MALDLKIDFSELTVENMGVWPLSIKIILCAFIFVVLLFSGYYFDISDQTDVLDTAARKEKALRMEFENKQAQSASLQAYKLQLQEIRHSFGSLLKQLPSKTEVPGLLEDISKSGIASGLEFKSFNPGQEMRHDFYAELPITIEVTGNYHQLGEFVSRVSALDRIVTLHDFQIKRVDSKPADQTPKVAATGTPIAPNKQIAENQLIMQLTAKTYRYMDDGETKPEPKKDDKPGVSHVAK